MLRSMLKSKIHRATVTGADLHYEGSLTLDRGLMALADVLPFEQVRVYNISTGQRFETYVIPGEEGSGTVCLNGAAARKGSVGDLIIVATYVLVTPDELESGRSRIILLGEGNRVMETKEERWVP